MIKVTWWITLWSDIRASYGLWFCEFSQWINVNVHLTRNSKDTDSDIQVAGEHRISSRARSLNKSYIVFLWDLLTILIIQNNTSLILTLHFLVSYFKGNLSDYQFRSAHKMRNVRKVNKELNPEGLGQKQTCYIGSVYFSLSIWLCSRNVSWWFVLLFTGTRLMCFVLSTLHCVIRVNWLTNIKTVFQFPFLNHEYRWLLVWRVISSHVSTERTCWLTLGWVFGVFMCNFFGQDKGNMRQRSKGASLLVL